MQRNSLELLRAAARRLLEQQQTGIAMTRVSELAGVAQSTGSRYRAMIEREFPHFAPGGPTRGGLVAASTRRRRTGRRGDASNHDGEQRDAR
jgi:hypothetical protein